MSYQELFGSFGDSFSNVGGYVGNTIPTIILAIVILFLGWVIGSYVGRLVARGINSIEIVERTGKTIFGEAVSRSGMSLNVGRFIGALIKLFVIVVFLVVALDVLNLDAINQFFVSILSYLPNVIAAAVILVAAAFIADILSKIIVGAAKAADLQSASVSGTITRWAIWIFAIFTALDQLGVSLAFIQPFYNGLVLAASIALGLAFGFGGKDLAGKWLNSFFTDANR